jgi:medium-chain acyl-[acyl-carrier-protein] hydrolase
MELLSPIVRADFEAIQTYRYMPDEPLDCPITAIGGLQDRDVDRESLEGWRQQTTSSFSLRMLPGDHFFVNSARDMIIAILAQTLALEH